MIGFTGCNVDRADNLRLDPAAIAELAGRSDARLLSLAGTDPELDGEGRLAWSQLPAMPDLSALIFLGLREGAALFAPLVPIDQGRAPYAVFRLIEMMAPEEAALWATARSLIAWHDRHGFCANCGAGTEPFRAGWGRICAACKGQHFPRVDPVVIMLAEHRGRVLVGRQPQYPPGRYSALAGFVEPGESIEEAVAREFAEEAGIRVKNVRYVASQPWPFPGQLMIACIAEAEDDALTIDFTELEDAMWVPREGVEAALARHPQAPFLAPPPFAIAHSLFRSWLEASQPLAPDAPRN
jgi:NAD+ diphosphatase